VLVDHLRRVVWSGYVRPVQQSSPTMPPRRRPRDEVNSMPKVRRALLSVSDKTGLMEFAQALRRFDVELLSSGGTAALMHDDGIGVTKVSDYTGFPEILDGRVKTLHPRVFAGILARDTPAHAEQLARHEIGAIDLVVVNLYPFEKTISRADVSIEEAVEQIDIGGPSMVRAAAKSHERVAVVVDPADYPRIIADMEANDGAVSPELRRRLAASAFQHTAAYDAAISNYFARQAEPDTWPESLTVQLRRVQGLRYGENPHQSGAFYGLADTRQAAPEVRFEQLQGKELSYNNIVDADAAWGLARELPGVGVCVIKHTNPCGAASAEEGDVAEVFARALEGDPVSAFGGIEGIGAALRYGGEGEKE
jgi:phosphoribosylaminoimidazolecarboxamide formyltransferase/IMP cyclohydrolase